MMIKIINTMLCHANGIICHVQEDAERLQRCQSKAPSVVMKSLVEKLKTDLAEKERKQKVKIENEIEMKFKTEGEN